MTSPRLSIISPVYCGANIVAHLVDRIIAAVSPLGIDFEILLVEDNSPDDSWEKIVAIAKEDSRISGIRLSRNFGQHAAITAGLANARGDHVVVMDCDLQDDPAFIPDMLSKAGEGYDLVLTRKDNRRHAWHRNLAARTFTFIFNTLAEHRPIDTQIGGYSLLSRKVVDAFLRIHDMHRHYLLILGWMGFKTAVVEVTHQKRHSGKSSYNLSRLFRHALEGITSQSTLLLKISVGVGFAYFCAALVGAVILCIAYFTQGFLAGWGSITVLLLASTSLILMAIGVLGIYIGQIFEQVRNRPHYLIQDYVNLNNPQ